MTICKNKAHGVDGDRHGVNFAACSVDGYCIKNCPFGAVAIVGKKISVEEAVRAVLGDEHSQMDSGGVSISGGEPMSQFDFTLNLLTELKKHNVHTCLDTAGYARTELFEEITSFVGIFLFDYKETDPYRHQEFTGVNQQLILKSLDLLYEMNARIILRCPIMPGYNDRSSHFEALPKLPKNTKVLK